MSKERVHHYILRKIIACRGSEKRSEILDTYVHLKCILFFNLCAYDF